MHIIIVGITCCLISPEFSLQLHMQILHEKVCMPYMLLIQNLQRNPWKVYREIPTISTPIFAVAALFFCSFNMVAIVFLIKKEQMQFYDDYLSILKKTHNEQPQIARQPQSNKLPPQPSLNPRISRFQALHGPTAPSFSLTSKQEYTLLKGFNDVDLLNVYGLMRHINTEPAEYQGRGWGASRCGSSALEVLSIVQWA